MKNGDFLVVSVYSLNDLDKINENTKYINIDISNPNHEIIDYFIENGENYKYTDIIDNITGYNYVAYNIFVKAENIIDMIYANMPNDLSELEMAKYLYVAIAKCVSYDINADTMKNELYDLSLITEMNNLWGSLAIGKVNDISASKLYYYLCRRLGIKIDIFINEEKKSSLTKLSINNQVLVTDLYEDIPFIKAKMQTKYFATYNDSDDIDKKIKYIKNKYNDYYLDKELKNIDYMNDECVLSILDKTEKILDIDNIKPYELGIIYKYIFNKYCPNYDIKINNLFLNSELKKHFIIVSYNYKHYSYNYKIHKFVLVNNDDILNNINIGKIGLYQDEVIPNIELMNLKR